MYTNLVDKDTNSDKVLVAIQVRVERDERKQVKLEKKLEKEGEKLLEAISERGINILAKNKQKLESSDLELGDPTRDKVQLDENDRLLWPVLLFFPCRLQADIVQAFPEDTTYVSHLRRSLLLSAILFLP